MARVPFAAPRSMGQEDYDMRLARSGETARVRRELAQLLRRLRAVRRDKLSRNEMLERIGAALAEAHGISRAVGVPATE